MFFFPRDGDCGVCVCVCVCSNPGNTKIAVEREKETRD